MRDPDRAERSSGCLEQRAGGSPASTFAHSIGYGSVRAPSSSAVRPSSKSWFPPPCGDRQVGHLRPRSRVEQRHRRADREIADIEPDRWLPGALTLEQFGDPGARPGPSVGVAHRHERGAEIRPASMRRTVPGMTVGSGSVF
jgi:hypothetical protein